MFLKPGVLDVQGKAVEAALHGTLALTDLTPEERLVTNAETDAAVAERLRTVHYGDVLAGDEVLTLLATDALARGRLAEKTLVVTVHSNGGVDAAVAAAGERWPRG